MSNQADNDQQYPIEKKKRLAKEISNMRNKSHLKKIKEVIFEENPDIAVNKDNRGMLMFFQNLTYPTYVRLDKLLRKIEKEKLEKQTLSITETSEHLLISSDADANQNNDNSTAINTNNSNNSINSVDYSKTRTRLRYSNKEKNLIKRQQYEKNINEKIDENLSTESKEYEKDQSSTMSNSESDHAKHKIEKTKGKTNNNSNNNKESKITTDKNKPKNTIFSKNTIQ